MTTLYVTVQLSIADDADDETIADAVFEVLVSGDWLLESPLDDQVQSVDGTEYRRLMR
jgi:hypothetical protein